MTTRIVTGLAAALVAATALATAAEAGGDGVRVPFGFPLGSFKATPARGGHVATPRAHKAPVRREAYAKPAPRIQKAAKPDKTPSVEVEPTPAADETSPVTGSSALIQSDIPPQATETPDAPAGEVKAEEAPAADTGPAVTASSEGGTDTCKKFIPAIGTTVTVGCDQ